MESGDTQRHRRGSQKHLATTQTAVLATRREVRDDLETLFVVHVIENMDPPFDLDDWGHKV